MSVARVNRYVNCIKPLMAQEALDMLPVLSFPHMKKGRAQSLEKKLRMATQTNIKTEAPRNTRELYEKLMGTLGNG